jgi:hypothetical protein
MHSAPSVTYPVGRLLLERVVSLALSALAALAALIMVVSQPWGWGPALTLSSGLGAWALHRRWPPSSPGRLSWDGKAWCLHRAAVDQEGRILVEWDLQGYLLLRFQPTLSVTPGPPMRAGGEWLWLSRQADPSEWADLRRAVYCRVS